MGWDFYDFANFLHNLWLSWVPFVVGASVLAPSGILSLYWGIFQFVHAFFITIVHCRMSSAWQKCHNDIFVLNWIQVNSNFWVYTCLTLFHLFWSLTMCFTHFAYVVHTRHTLGTSHASCCTPHASHAIHTCISSCSAQTHTCTVTYFVDCVYAY